jgi:hypothetical protein
LKGEINHVRGGLIRGPVEITKAKIITRIRVHYHSLKLPLHKI